MSYNISQWKTQRLENLVIPFQAFFKHERSDWHPRAPKVLNVETGEVSIACGCEQEIKGLLSSDGQLAVTEFSMTGEGSGTFMNWILMPALKESKGTLEAVLIWERGDSIERLIVQDGVITETPIEL